MNGSSPPPRTPSEEIAGLVERVTFFNEESGFAVLRVKVRGQRELVTVLGSLPSVSAGEWLTATGWWVRDKEHGLQFKSTVLKAIPPTTSEGVERYLAGGFVKGVGPVLAKKLVGHFGAEVLGVIEKNPADLESVDGIGPKRRERIANAWQEGMQIREIMLFLHSHGVSTGRAVRIYKTYGNLAIQTVQENPYTLAKEIHGIGFATADQIAQSIGVPKDSQNRARAGVAHVLLGATSEGHCALPLEKLKAAAVKLLEVPVETIEQAVTTIPKGHRLDPIRDIQVLCPMNRGSIGVRELNTMLQTTLNPVRPGEPTVERFGWRFQVRDKVIQTVNDYKKEVFNGDIGIVEKIDPVEQELSIRFDDRLVTYDFGELDEVSLAYAVTIHKSQGSEFSAVVIPVAMQHYMLLQRNLIYTGITRAKRLLVIVGQKKALGLAVRNDQARKRYSGLLNSLNGSGQ
jgi:ATP-dependent exoDNAse (exonuclease V) alpha subunit